MRPEQPTDPMTQLQSAAASLHELFLAYQNAGFTRAEALYLVARLAGPTGEPN